MIFLFLEIKTKLNFVYDLLFSTNLDDIIYVLILVISQYLLLTRIFAFLVINALFTGHAKITLLFKLFKYLYQGKTYIAYIQFFG